MSQSYSITIFTDTRIFSSNNPGAATFDSLIPHGFIGFNASDRPSEYYGFAPIAGSTPVGQGAVTPQVDSGQLHEWDYAYTVQVNKAQFDAMYAEHQSLQATSPTYVFPLYDCVSGYMRDILYAGFKADPANGVQLLSLTTLINPAIAGLSAGTPYLLEAQLRAYAAASLGQGTTRASELPGYGQTGVTLTDARTNYGIPEGQQSIPILDAQGNVQGFRYDTPTQTIPLSSGGTRYVFADGTEFTDLEGGDVVLVTTAKTLQWSIPDGEGGSLMLSLSPLTGDVTFKNIDENGTETLRKELSLSTSTSSNAGYRFSEYEDGILKSESATAIVGANSISATYIPDAAGNLTLSSIDSINGAAPTAVQADALRAALILNDISPDDLTSGTLPAAAQTDIATALTPSGTQTLQNLLTSGTLIDALSLLKAIQTGEPLPVLASGLRLANDISNLNNLANLELSGAANVASGVLSLLSLEAALQQGDTLAAVTAGAQTLSFAANAYKDFLIVQAGGDAVVAAADNAAAFHFAQDLGEMLPALNLVNAIAQGDEVGVAVAVTDMVMMSQAVAAYSVPYIGWAYAVYSIVDSLFGGDDAPEPWGSGRYVWQDGGMGVSAVGEAGGAEAVSGVMNQVRNALDNLIAQAQNPAVPLGLIPNRMPGVSYGTDGYRYTDIDPLTGAERHPELRFDTAGNPYNATPGSPEAYRNLTEALLRTALARGAIAPRWEADTARLQTQAGDPQAGLTEEERAGRAGKLAAAVAGTSQTWRPVALDLDGDGIETRDRSQANAVFDVDDSGFLKNTSWLAADDAFLALDRNANGQIDSSRELFSNGAVALERRGLAGMAWVDANADGKLNSADPVFSELKLWRDQNGDGVQAAGELTTLSDLGISELNYALSRYTRAGQERQMGSPDLQADAQGSRINVVPKGILIQSSANHNLSLIVTCVNEAAANDKDWRKTA